MPRTPHDNSLMSSAPSASMSRRQAIRSLGAIAGSVPLLGLAGSASASSLRSGTHATTATSAASAASAIRHSVSRWPYNGIPLDTFCAAAKAMGIESVELVGPSEWPILKKHGLHCAMPNGADRLGITRGFNDPSLHGQLQADYRDMIPKVAEAGYDKLICFSGNRNGLDDEEGIERCAMGLKPLMADAERHGVTLVMELLNSKVDHRDYQCDRTAWGVRLVDAVGSDRFRLLYDIYHMQIMEGDVIRTIRDYADYIVHYHTGGVPGRNEIDETQELQYPAIIRAIAETGYTGYIGQEFIPTWDDPLEALKDGIARCSV